MSIIHLDYHLHQLPRHISIFSKRHPRHSRSLVNATAMSNRSIGLSLLAGDHSCLSQDDLSSSLDFKLRRQRFNSCHHVVDDHSFLLVSVVVKTSLPSLECLEAEGEWVLSRWKSAAIEDHCFLSSEHISFFIVSHPEIPVGWSPDILGSEIRIIISFWLAIRYV